MEVRLPRTVSKGDETNVEIERAFLAREQVSPFWMATGALDPEVRAAAFSTGATVSSPTVPLAVGTAPR